MVIHPGHRLDTRGLAVRILETVAAAVLLAVAVGAARDFRMDAVRDFRFTWGTWSAAVALAFAAGAVLSVGVSLPSRSGVVVPALVVATIVLVHLPAVLAGGAAWHHWSVFATTSFVDRTGPQLLAAVVAGAAIARLGAGVSPRSVRGSRGEPVE
ncbi:MAG: hypothetical protein ACXVQU_05410 [Actinomycetota bacterium]